MMKKHTRVLALGLTCTALLSLASPAMAARQNNSTTPISASGTTSVTIPSDGTLSFSQIGTRVRANNLSINSMNESLKPWIGIPKLKKSKTESTRSNSISLILQI